MKNERRKLKSAVILLIYTQSSIRDSAKMLGVSPGNLYAYIYTRLKKEDQPLYHMARRQMIENAKRWKGEQAYDLRPLD